MDVLTPEQRRKNMQAIKSKKTKIGGNEKIEFTELPKQKKIIQEILEEESDSKYTLSDKL